MLKPYYVHFITCTCKRSNRERAFSHLTGLFSVFSPPSASHLSVASGKKRRNRRASFRERNRWKFTCRVLCEILLFRRSQCRRARERDHSGKALFAPIDEARSHKADFVSCKAGSPHWTGHASVEAALIVGCLTVHGWRQLELCRY